MQGYYYQTRRGKRIKVKKGRNRLNIYNGSKVKRAVVRGGVETKSGQIYGKGVLSIGDRSGSIKSQDGIAISKQDGSVKVVGRLGKVKGGVVVGKKQGRKIDAIAYSQPEEERANFEYGYYYQTRNGKRVRVRKKRSSRKLLRAAELLGTSAGLVGGAKAGEALVNAAGRNGMIRNSAMAGGGLAGGAIALMLVDKAMRRNND